MSFEQQFAKATVPENMPPQQAVEITLAHLSKSIKGKLGGAFNLLTLCDHVIGKELTKTMESGMAMAVWATKELAEKLGIHYMVKELEEEDVITKPGYCLQLVVGDGKGKSRRYIDVHTSEDLKTTTDRDGIKAFAEKLAEALNTNDYALCRKDDVELGITPVIKWKEGGVVASQVVNAKENTPVATVYTQEEDIVVQTAVALCLFLTKTISKRPSPAGIQRA